MRFVPDTGGELRSNGRIRRTGLAQIRNVSRQGTKTPRFFKALSKPEALAG
jgi:hypothetical protein